MTTKMTLGLSGAAITLMGAILLIMKAAAAMQAVVAMKGGM